MLVGHAQVHAVRPTQPAPKRQNRPPTALTRQARTGPHNTHVRLKTRTGSSGKKAATAKDPWPLRGSGRSAKHPASAHAFKQARGQGRTRPNSPVTWASMLRQDNTHSHSPPPPARAPHPPPSGRAGPARLRRLGQLRQQRAHLAAARQEVPAHRATRRSPGSHVQGFGARCQANTVCQTVRHRAHVAAPRRAARLVGVRPPRRPERARSAAGACAPGLRAVAADGAREQVLRRQLERQRRPGLARAVAVRRTIRRTERRSERRAVAGRVQVEPVVVVVVWVMPCAQGGQPLVRALGP